MSAPVLQTTITPLEQELITPEQALTLLYRCDNPDAIYWLEKDTFIMQDQSVYLYRLFGISGEI